MVESDDEFTELCSKLLKRVKKNKPSAVQNIPKTSTTARSRLKRVKPSESKKQTCNGANKEAVPNITAGPGSEKPSDSCGAERSSTVQTHLSNGVTDKEGIKAESPVEIARPLDQLSVKQLVVERMQQFKRTSPNRMRLDSVEDYGARESSEALHTDGDLALALEMDIKEQPVTLEDQGLFFCQLCQKDLTAMSGVLREQHVNRCLDQDESLGGSSAAPVVPSCPLCGKPFNTQKSRASHLKRCAVTLEVPAQTLLQAVQRQEAETVPPRVVHVKRKGAPKQKEPSKKRKVAPMGAEVEDLLVAMALSRSMQEENTEPKPTSGVPPREIPPPEKKRRRKQKEKPTPLLLLQAPEEAVQKLQKRMSMLLSEEAKDNSVITLPPSRFWSLELKEWETWSMRGGKTCVLWEFSSKMETRDVLSYYTAELNPPITPWIPPAKKLLNSQQPDASTTLTAGKQSHGPGDKDLHPVTPCEDKSQLTDSQKALQDLAELAGEGMTLTQWNCAASGTSDRTGRDSPAGMPSSGFIAPQEEEEENVKQSPPPFMAPLVSLASDFMELVNNPHLCDAQLQTDCGEVLNVHMLVLYARCPLLVEAVHSEGFWVQEASTGRMRRLLLNDVSAEASLCFLRFLYSASTAIPSHCLAHVCELAYRFDVKSLIEVCEQLVGEVPNSEAQVTTEEDRDNGGERAETFQELLKSVWFNEGEDPFTDIEAEGQEEEHLENGGVGEVELEEIYEFAATQRKMPIEQDKEGGSGSEHDVEPQDKEPEVSSPEATNHVVQTSLMNTPTLKVYSAQEPVNYSPVGKSPAHLNLNSLESSPSFPTLGSPVSLKTRLSPTSCTSPVRAPSILSVRANCPARRLFTNELVNRTQSTSATPEKHTAPAAHTISLISPNRSEDAEGDMFAEHSLPPLDDSYDRMFSETCGEYVEPSGICESRTHVNPTSPQDQKPMLTSSPSKVCPMLSEIGSKIQSQAESFLESSSYSQADHEKSPPCDSHHKSSNKANYSPKALSPDQDIILILSSDEETEFSTQSAKQNINTDLSKSIKESPVSFSVIKGSENLSHLEMSSSSETSWLVPATPLPSITDSRVSQMQSSRFPWSPQSSLQTSYFPKSSKACLQTSSLPKSPKASLQTSYLTKSPKASLQTSHLPQSPKASLQTSYLPKSPKASLQTSHLPQSPKASLQTSYLPKSPKASLQTSHLPQSPKASLQTSHLPKSPKASLQTSHLPQSPKACLQTSHLPKSPQTSLQTSHLPKSPKASIQTSHLPKSPKASLQTSHLPKSPKASLQTSHLSQSPKACLQTSHLPKSPKASLQTSHLPHSPQTSLQTSYLPHSPQTSLQNSPLHLSPKTSKIYNLSFADPSQTSPVSLKSPKISFTLNESLCSNITEKSKNPHEVCSSTAGKEPCSPQTSITNNTVFEVGDSEDEGPVPEPQANTSGCSFQMDYDEPPIHIEDMWSNMEETPTRPYSFSEHTASSPICEAPSRAGEMQHSSPLQKGNPEPGSDMESPNTTALQSNQKSYLNSKLWDEWGDEDPELPAVLSLTQRLTKVPGVQKELRTPVSIVRRREVIPKVPITPLPHYSDMDTPVLKKELNRFGVRALPKKQMVLKLKEIFSYTHQLMSSDSEDEVPFSQKIQSRDAQPRRPPAPSKQRPGATSKASKNLKIGKKVTSVCAAQETDTGDDQSPTASQESATSSVAASDTSSLSQSSNTNEFETAFADEDDDEPVAASQAASKEAEAVRRFIEARPELHKRILLYQPLELSALHAELKQSGIKMAAGKLLDFLDAQCVTFTTASARKEKKTRGKRKAGKRH